MESFNDWIAAEIKRILENAAENRLSDFGDCPVFAAPAIAIVDGDDEIFGVFQKRVSPDHLLPRKILEKEGRPPVRPDSEIRVVALALPFTSQIRLSNREGEWPSPLYSIARNNGGALSLELARRLADAIHRKGHSAIVPHLTDGYDVFRHEETGFTSTWSERHIAYAAGLGTFGLNGFLITPLGAMVRLQSLVTDLPLTPTPPRPEDHRAPCFIAGGTECNACAIKCPAKAISAGGPDKEMCYLRRKEIRDRSLELYVDKYELFPTRIASSGRKFRGISIGCAVCASGVPCESCDPFAGPEPLS